MTSVEEKNENSTILLLDFQKAYDWVQFLSWFDVMF
jgi:hypothetical protein